MRRHRLPNTDLEVSTLCFGASSFGTGVRNAEADRLTAAFVEAGGNFFDTAHCYAFWEPNGLGASERELGASLRRLGLQDKVIVATKGGHPDWGAQYPRPADFLSEQVILSDIEESLERLGVSRIDLYYLHRDDGRTPVGEIIEMLNREVQRGRLRALGASNWSVTRLAEANAYAAQKGLQGFAASQIQGSLAEPKWQPDADPTTRYATDTEWAWHSDAGLPLVLYSATAGGYFANATGSGGLYDSPANQMRRERARELSARLGCTPTQVALAYLMAQSPPVVPLFGTTNPTHLTEILGAVSVALTPEQVRWLHEG